MPTIIDVAQLAQVSIMTVSRVINNSGPVSQETYDKVTKAIKELGYISNLTARSLATKLSTSIGVLIATIQNPYYGRVVLGVEHIAEKYGYSVQLINAINQEKYDDYITNIISRGLSGVIADHLNFDKKHIDRLSSYGVRCVLVDNEQNVPDVFSIYSDHYYGAVEAIEYLISLGHQRIGFIHSDIIPAADQFDWEPGMTIPKTTSSKSGFEESYSYRLWAERYRGYMDTMLKRGLAVDKCLIQSGDAGFENNVSSGMLCMEKFLQLSEPPTAIYAGNDLFAIGVLNAAQKHGLQIPQDISIIGHGGIDATQYTFPILSSMKQPRFEIGAMASSTLIKLIDDKQANHIDLIQIVRPVLIKGASTAPPQ